MLKLRSLFPALLLSAAIALPAHAQGKGQHVVMVVWDGMRPDFVTEKYTPNLYKLSKSGVFFSKHHPVWPSSTEVNGTALATGMHPGNSGTIGNKEYRPEINPLKSINTDDPEAIRKADQSGNKFLKAATVAEILQAQGVSTSIAGTKGVAILHDRAEKAAGNQSAAIYEGMTNSPAALEAVKQAQGAFPEKITYPNTQQDTWTTGALTNVLWKNGVPKFSVLWLSDVDYTQHDQSPGSPGAIAALKSCDDRLGTVLSALEAKGVRANTNVMLVSDHGFSTIGRQIDLYKELQGAGFAAPKTFTEPPKQGEILINGLGGAAHFYIGGHDPAVAQRLVDFLQTRDYVGVIFSKAGLPGTFQLGQVKIDKDGAPDVSISFRWSGKKNQFGARGVIDAEGSRKAGQGTHVTLGPTDMNNTLIAAGPDFKSGLVSKLPSGNIDVAPTILYLLGVKPPKPQDGRVLMEALNVPGEYKPVVKTGRLETSAEVEGKKRSQFLQWTRVDGALYFDEGNSK